MIFCQCFKVKNNFVKISSSAIKSHFNLPRYTVSVKTIGMLN